MKPPHVVNYKQEKDKSRVHYIGRAMPAMGLRASPFANPFKIGKDTAEAREESLAQYRAHLLAKPELLDMLPSLAGKALACWCYPKRCHGDILVEVFNERLLTWPADKDHRTQLHFHLCVRGCFTEPQAIQDLQERHLIPGAYTRFDMIPNDVAKRALIYFGDLLGGRILEQAK